MSKSPRPLRLGFFSRLLDDAPAAERYRLVAAQIVHAEALGFDSAWVAQHHFHEHGGRLPSPFVFLAYVASRIRRIRLGTGIVTLPLENAVRVAEDAIVLDLLSGGRLEVGVGTGGTPESFAAFGLDGNDRSAIFARQLAVVRSAWAGRQLAGGDTLYPSGSQLPGRIWQATFSVSGGTCAGEAGDGLMLSRTQPRPEHAPHASPSLRTSACWHATRTPWAPARAPTRTSSTTPKPACHVPSASSRPPRPRATTAASTACWCTRASPRISRSARTMCNGCSNRLMHK